MNVDIDKELVVICEGRADNLFLKQLIRERGERTAFAPIQFLKEDELKGKDSFKRLLEGISAFPHVKGILIVADSTDNPETAFNNIACQIKDAGYVVPSKPLDVTKARPAVSVILIPDEKTPGGLETLCVEVLKEKAPHIAECTKAYFSCGKIKVNQWNEEKQAKAWYGAMVAAFYEDEPTKVVASAFRRNDRERAKNLPPLIPVTHKCFDSVEKRIRDFCDEVLNTTGVAT